MGYTTMHTFMKWREHLQSRGTNACGLHRTVFARCQHPVMMQQELQEGGPRQEFGPGIGRQQVDC